MDTETEEIKEMTRGMSTIECPDCGEAVHWGSLRFYYTLTICINRYIPRYHRASQCSDSRWNLLIKMCPDNSYFSCYDRLNKYSNMLTMNTHTWRTSSIILRFLMVIMIFVVVFIELDFAWGFQNYIIFGIWNLTIKEDEKPKIKFELELSWAQ